MAIWYVDSSAAVKLIADEKETAALRRWLKRRRWILSDLHRTELRRASSTVGGAARARVEEFLDECEMIRVDADVFDAAGRLSTEKLRSLDAIHIAAAQSLGPDLAGIVAYDSRLVESARETGIETSSPGGSARRQ